jgi:hypothetical protein
MSRERSLTRQTLEAWRLRLEKTQAHYHEAQKRYILLLKEQLEGTPHDPNGGLAVARQAESDALAEYTRVLRAFTDLTVNGKIPEDRSEAGSGGV